MVHGTQKFIYKLHGLKIYKAGNVFKRLVCIQCLKKLLEMQKYTWFHKTWLNEGSQQGDHGASHFSLFRFTMNKSEHQ